MCYKGKNISKTLLFCILIIILDVSLSSGKVILDQSQNRDIMSKNLDNPPCLTLRVHNVGDIGFTVSNNGQFGTGFLDFPAIDPMTGQPAPSCEYPLGSGNEYLYSGSLWIGAIVGEDTLVSIGADGWSLVREFYPEVCPGGDMIYRSIYGPYSADAVSEQDFEAIYFDTLTDPTYVENDPFDGRPHIPLNVKVTQKSYAWSEPELNDFVIMEYVIKNIGTSDLKKAYVGFYVDGDVVANGEEETGNGFQDDITGFLRTAPSVTAPPECGFIDTVDIAWIADNDGHRNDQSYGCPDNFALRGVTGIKILRTPIDSSELYNYNWWIPNEIALLDWGPRRAGTPEDPFRDFGGFLGTPAGDANKYYMMSHPEVDYDQIFAAVDQTADGWLPPGNRAWDIANGIDTRYLFSFGPFDLSPGQSTTFYIAYVAGADFHTDCEAFNDLFNADNPQAFYNQLNFDNLVANATAACEKYDIPGYDTDGDFYRGKFRICENDTFWYEGDGVTDLIPLGQTTETKLQFKPDPQMLVFLYAYPAIEDTIFIGNVNEFNILGVDPADVMINGTIPATSVTVLESHPGFMGPVLQVLFPAKDFIENLGVIYGQSTQQYTVTGSTYEETEFSFEGEIEFIGHLLGDVNGDDKIDLLDILYLIDYIYGDGAAPLPGVEFGDVNRDGDVNLLDILKIIEIVY